MNLNTRFLLLQLVVLVTAGSPPASGDSLQEHTVFRSAQVVTTKLVTADGQIGISAMDARCQAKAQDAGLDGTWLAILSDSTADAKQRMSDAGALGPFFNTRNQLLASDIEDLFDGTLSGANLFNEFGSGLGDSGESWTATLDDGTYAGASYEDWTSLDGKARVGRTTAIDSTWISYLDRNGLESKSLYCVRSNREPIFVELTEDQPTHRIFVTSSVYEGQFGGFPGADQSCQDSANVAALGGTWKAILSDSASNARDRIHVFGPVVTNSATPQRVATGFDDLFDGGVAAFVRFDEFGSLQHHGKVWTGTDPNGFKYSSGGPGKYRQDWTADTGAVAMARTLEMDADWLHREMSFPIDVGQLYCIEQCPSGSNGRACSGQGRCVNGAETPGLVCECDLGFDGVACESPEHFEESADQQVFVTSTLYDGNLGGLAGADLKCQERANAAGLAGSWIALLSTGEVDARDRTIIPGSLGNLAGVSDLTGSSSIWTDGPVFPIDIDEFGNRVAGGPVWTGSSMDGKVADSETCDDWSSLALTASAGGSSETESWFSGNPQSCQDQARLYCIQSILGTEFMDFVFTPGNSAVSYAFVSSERYQGSELVGPGGADRKCEALAAEGGWHRLAPFADGKKRVWRAVLGASVPTPGFVMNTRGGVQLLESESDQDGTQVTVNLSWGTPEAEFVAEGEDFFFNGCILGDGPCPGLGLVYDEQGRDVRCAGPECPDQRAWTGQASFIEPTCDNWQVRDLFPEPPQGRYGVVGALNGWLSSGDADCTKYYHLYCLGTSVDSGEDDFRDFDDARRLAGRVAVFNEIGGPIVVGVTDRTEVNFKRSSLPEYDHAIPDFFVDQVARMGGAGTIKGSIMTFSDEDVAEALAEAREDGVEMDFIVRHRDTRCGDNPRKFDKDAVLRQELCSDDYVVQSCDEEPSEQTCNELSRVDFTLCSGNRCLGTVHQKIWTFDTPGSTPLAITTSANFSGYHLRIFNDLLAISEEDVHTIFRDYLDENINGARDPNWGNDRNFDDSGNPLFTGLDFSVFFAPNNPGEDGEDDERTKILDRIQCDPESKVHIAMSYLSSQKVIDGIIELADRGCDVKLITSPYSLGDERNTEAFRQLYQESLENVNLEVIGMPGFECPGLVGGWQGNTHSKYMIAEALVDGDFRRVVWTGSKNWTEGNGSQADVIFELRSHDPIYHQYRANWARQRAAAEELCTALDERTGEENSCLDRWLNHDLSCSGLAQD